MSKKMNRAARRDQLLENAHIIVREEGTEALTLSVLAERAGVSKPITYSHFETRSGLMTALYKQINDKQVHALACALEQTPTRLQDVAQKVARAFMDCSNDVGWEWHVIGAALKGDAQMDAYQRELTEQHLAFYARTFSPFSPLSAEEVRRRCIGILGAGEAISEEMSRGGMTRDEAVNDMASLIVSWLAGR